MISSQATNTPSYLKVVNVPDKLTIEDQLKGALPCDVRTEIWRGSYKDNSDHIYKGLKKNIIKPDHISDIRFQKILTIKAQLLNKFLHRKNQIDSALDKLEAECKLQMLVNNFSVDKLYQKKLCPQKFYKVKIESKTLGDKTAVYSYHPIISPEITQIEYPEHVLTIPLKKQLQKNSINIRSKNTKDFFASTSWHTFFGAVNSTDAQRLINDGNVFTEALDFPDTDSRIHGCFTHAIQEFIISIFLERKIINDLSVPGERDITELDLLKADSWLIKTDNSNTYNPNDPDALFDITRERYSQKFLLFDYYPSSSENFTDTYFVNFYLTSNHERFPVLSTLLYNQYALETLRYFDNRYTYFNKENKYYSSFDLTEEEKLIIANYHFNDINVPITYCDLFHKHSDKYLKISECKENSWITLKRNLPNAGIMRSQDDSDIILTRKLK